MSAVPLRAEQAGAFAEDVDGELAAAADGFDGEVVLVVVGAEEAGGAGEAADAAVLQGQGDGVVELHGAALGCPGQGEGAGRPGFGQSEGQGECVGELGLAVAAARERRLPARIPPYQNRGHHRGQASPRRHRGRIVGRGSAPAGAGLAPGLVGVC
ncbi:hypothetical protein [Streptomyces sp. HNM1019]|uniref:hypothetical protein n=1 Tax=Streptomyces sp. HNM1019 TaxID=3424717 RepID=UPI003D770FFD